MAVKESFEILAISGSLRANSSNTALLQAAAILTPPNVRISFYRGIGDLPHYNPDREDEPIATVKELRERIKGAAGILICSPEYARGIPGVLKNALDWLVGGVEIVRKPVAVINASPHSVHADAALKLILETMSADVIAHASVTVPVRGRKISAEEMAVDAAIAVPLRAAMGVFAAAMEKARNAPTW